MQALAVQTAGQVERVFAFSIRRPLHKKKDWLTAKRSKPHSRWTFQELLDDLGAQIPAWRVNAQEELIQRGTKHVSGIIKAIQGGQLSEGQETWAAWALAELLVSPLAFSTNLKSGLKLNQRRR